MHQELRMRRDIVGALQPQDLIGPLGLSQKRFVQGALISLAVFDERLGDLQEGHVRLALSVDLLIPGLRFQRLLHRLEDGLGLLLSSMPCRSSLFLAGQLRCGCLTKSGAAREPAGHDTACNR
ncbi:hypothetical protein ABZY36_02625 [Streptomyces sp. NPDC006627]|uniref:hypothetical protein n=1 Tax=Streptomyces sp. NPDC006627 TaxID=3154679 RepID=UPI0033B182D2